jgi:predicted enzyme related to lactoylglutathione lyase
VHPDGDADSVHARLTERDRLLGDLDVARFDAGPQLGPAREAVAAGDGELSRVEGVTLGNAPELAQCAGVAGLGRVQQVLRLVAELVEVGVSRECRHDASFTGLRSACQIRSPFCKIGGMERVLGIGGYFIRAADPAALSAWYRDCLGLDADQNGLWRHEAGPTVFATFESETDYFGSRAQQTMLNFRVRDLDAMLAQLRAKAADVAEETQDMEGVGRFGWVTDPEGNRVELWQPA